MANQMPAQHMANQQMAQHMANQQMANQQMASQVPVPHIASQMLFQETTSQMPTYQMDSQMQVGALPFDKPPGDAAMQNEAQEGSQKEAQKKAQKDSHKEARPPARKPIEQTPRQAAMDMLQNGDIVEAMDRVTTKCNPATVHAIAKNGLVEVRWNDPGMDDKGKPYHPIGEVWAEQIRLKWRLAPVVASTPQKAAATVEEEPVLPPDGLQIGDSCYAMGQVVAKAWFATKLIGVRARSPPMRVEYIATLDGQT